MKKAELLSKISEKERELNNLRDDYGKILQSEKKEVLKSNSEDFKKSLYLLGFEFESSSQTTEQYKEFHRVFRNELKKVLKPYIKELDYSKTNHFDISEFIKLNDDRIFYFSISDLRWSKDSLLIRTAENFKDYSGGSNDYVKIDENFKESLLNKLGVLK